MKLGVHVKRACIYFIYDKDGIIDDYILFQLQELRKNVAFLHCVINGTLTENGALALQTIADEIYVRENKGNDIGAYKAAIKKISWNKLGQYDELVLMNNTCFGPVYPFQEAFDWASSQDIDFWGLTWGLKCDWLGTTDYPHYNKSKVHIQSYFLTLRKPLLGSELLVNFFDEIPEDATYAISGSCYEYAFPGYFEDYGYKGGVYCDINDDYNYPLLYDPVRLLRDYRMPLFKKRSFFHHYTDVLNNTAGEATKRLLLFLETETDFNMDMVWTSLLRTCNLSDLVRCAQLNRVLPRDAVVPREEKKRITVGLVYHAYYEDLFDEDIRYMSTMPEDSGLLVTTSSAEKKLILENKLAAAGIHGNVVVIENRGRDVSSLLVCGKCFVFHYDLVCFAHDKKTSQVLPHSVGRSWAYKINENVFATKAYVSNVIALFEREKRLGIAFPAYPSHSGYANNIGTGWTGNFTNTKKLLNALGVDVLLNEHALCVAPLGTCFWFRPCAMKKLFDGLKGDGWSYSDFPKEPNRTDQTILHAVERAYAYVAQDAGYYPVFVYNDQYTAIELTNLEFNKTGSSQMRAWMDQLAMESLGGQTGNEPFNEQAVQNFELIRNYGIRQSLRFLAIAMRSKYPRFWSFLLPIRKIGKRVLKIETK